MDDFPTVLRLLRARSAISQRRLAEVAGVSARHISWLETGRARPSRHMVCTLGAALESSFRETNLMLDAAGFSPEFREHTLDHPDMQPVRQAVELLLRSHDPLPGLVVDRRWNAVLVNRGFAELHRQVTGEQLTALQVLADGTNLVDAFFHNYRPYVLNFDEAIAQLLPRLERQALVDPSTRRRLEAWSTHLAVASAGPIDTGAVVYFDLALADVRLKLFTTFTMLGMPNDITSQELSVELFHPADAFTRAVFQNEPATTPQ